MAPEYLPWAKKTLRECLKMQSNGFMPTLDLELTAKCSKCSCIYCDSKPDVQSCIDYKEIANETIIKVLDESIPLGLKWVYTCGLGEPLEDQKFWDMLHHMANKNIRLSMFSNGIFINNIATARELKKYGVCIILKMDTFDETAFDNILGYRGTAAKIYNARDLLLEAGYAHSDEYTDLAFSIVPTSISIEGIPDVIDYCKKYKIFASIGELERAGEVINKGLTSTLGIDDTKVASLKICADTYYDGCYMRPICPCILTGIHIDNIGNCVVDRITGLNCKWFLLTEPDILTIGNIYDSPISELFRQANEYRSKAFLENRTLIDTSFDISYIFGGCGGNPPDIIRLVREEQGV
jgi:MoaA/NifB/PqqE/SkfB family radical SAM enzyme